MAIGILAKKLGMTSLYNEHGRIVAVTVLQAGPCTVIQVKGDKAGTRAIQVGYEPVKDKKLTKALQGHFKKAGTGSFRYLREFNRLPKDGEFNVGQELKADIFKEGELVDITGTSVGKGFQGGVRRWNWKGGPATHGSMSHRAPGSIGSTTFPGRVIKGHHLPGHMGNAKVTVQNLRVMRIDLEENLLMIEGAVPGPEDRLIVVRKSLKRPGVIKAARQVQEVAISEEEEKKGAKPKKK